MQRADVYRLACGLVYRVSPGETALPFHRKRPAYEAPTKKMLKYCGDELDPKSRTMLDYHPVEVAWQMALAARADFVLVRPSELMSRLDEGRGRRARATARTSSASSDQFNRISRWVASEIVRVTDTRRYASACSSASSSWHTAAATCRTCTRMYAVYVGLNQCAVQRLKSVWEKLSTKWEKCYAELDQLCNPKSNSAALRALLRCEHEWA